jgi:hypothetical protein
MRNQQLFEVPFASEVGTEYCSKCTSAGAGKCRCRRCQGKTSLSLHPNSGLNLSDEAQWLFEAPAVLLTDGNHPTSRQSWLFEPFASPEADYMAGKRRKGKEHTSLTGGSKTRLKPKHQKGKSRKLKQETAADRRVKDADRSVKQRKRSRASILTGLERPTEVQVVDLIQAKQLEQKDVKAALETARQRRNYAEAEELEKKYWQLEKHIKDLKQFRLTLR